MVFERNRGSYRTRRVGPAGIWRFQALDSAPELPQAPNWLVGLWRRESIEMRDGTLDRTTRVFWGQTRNLFVDIRIPSDRPAPPGGRGFEDFTLEELGQIAEQHAFAGHVAVDGDRCTWHRCIDYQPNTGRPDTGRLRLEGDILHEQGDAESVIGMDYHEVYRREIRGEERRLALRLDGCEGAPFGERPAGDAILVVLDDRFMFARTRPCDLGPADTLHELVQRADGDRASIEACLDCEVSIGRLGKDDRAWRIELSTLPWREGERLFPRGQAGFEPGSNLLCLDTPAGRAHWRIFDTSLPGNAVCEPFNA